MLKKSLLLTLLLALLVPWAANAQKALPYSYGFENNDLDAEGWTVQKTSSSTGISPSAKHEGSYGFQFNYSEQNAYLVSPVLSGTESGVALSFYYKESSNSYGDEQFYVGYTTDETVTDPSSFTYGDITTASLSWELYEVTLPAGTKKVAIKYVYNDALYLYLDDFTFEAPSSCPKPSGLNVALTPGNGTVATLSWTSEATAWQICLNDDETNLIAATTNPFQLTGLTPETTYTAKVRANCGSEQSGWSNEVTFKPTNAYQLTVNDGTSTNGYVPIYGYYVDAITKSQFIIPASELTAMAWGTINKMTFYANNSSVSWGNAQFEVYLTETDETTLSALADYSTMTKVKNAGSLSISGNQMVVEFDTPFNYTGGNLMIGFLQTASGSWSSCNWYGVVATGASMGGYGSSISQQNFLPKTTFSYTPGEQPSCMWPTNFAVSNITARTADLSWTSEDAREWQICINDNEAALIDIDTNPYTLTGLDPETVYDVKIRANCGSDDYSDWTNNIGFTTDVLCHAPTNLIISDITAFTADASWDAETTSELRYVAVTPNDLFFQGFVTDPGAMSNGADASWIKGESTLWGPGAQYSAGNIVADDFTVNAATTLSEIEVYGYQTGSTTTSTFTGLYAMIYNGNPADGGTLVWGDMETNLMTSTSFTNCYRGSDNTPNETTRPVMAITASGLNINLAAGTYYLLYSLDGTGSSGPWVVPQSDPVLGNIGDAWQYTSSSGSWAPLTDSGSGPYGLAMKLTFGDIDSYDWTTISNISDGQYAMTNLTPATLYLVQVRGNCSEANSAWVSKTFTTLYSCLFPTDLAVSAIEARQAVLSWTENGEATEWEVEVTTGDQTTTRSTTQNPFTLTGLNPETDYTVRVRSLCSDTESSEWSLPISFTTDVACHAPTSLAINDITNVSAVASWVYEGTVELEYREHNGEAGYTFDDSTMEGWTTIDADGDGYDWVLGSACGGIYLADGGSLAGSGHNSSADLVVSGSYSNVEGVGALTPDNYLVSPQITLGGSITFYACAQDATYPQEHFGVAVSTGSNTNPDAFTTIQEWTLTAKGRGIENVADRVKSQMRGGNRDQGNWYEYTVDLSAYSGQGYVAIRHFNCTDNFLLNVDDITIEQPGGVEPEWIVVNNPANPYTLMGLTPSTTYQVKVRAICGGDDGESVWVSTSFTTDVACPTPTALAATPYASSAVLSWEGNSESYTVSYRTAAYTDGTTEEFATSSAPTGWTMYTGLLSNVMEDPTALVSATYGWTFGTGNGVFDSHARCNIYGNYQRWLVTPAIEVPAGTAFSFDMALTAFSGTVAAPALTGTDDKFVVLVSTDEMASWTILREWNNSGSEYVYNNIANTATGENVSFDFSAYAGQTVNIAFYGESTVSNADNNLHIDNVGLGVAIPAGAWQTVTVDEATATLIGLTPETKYDWKVQGDCGEYGMSEESAIASFTTTNDPCPVPTNLTVDEETLTATTADLSWDGSPDVESFTVRYRVPEHAEKGSLYEPFNANGYPTGWTRYSGLVDEVVAGTDLTPITSGGWASNNIALGAYNMKLNIYGTFCKYWLVSPEVKPTNGNFTFDLALTDYGNSNPIEDVTVQADDRFVVLVYANNAWTILREWNNSGSAYVYNTISTTGEQVSIDLSAYVGQTIKIAFYGESTNPSGMENTGGDNDMHIDNVLVGTLIPATDWMTEERITETSVTLTGLTPETTYEAQVKADCSEAENPWSNVLTFTTPEEPALPLSLAAGINWVSFNVETTLDDLKAALVEALPGTAITIQSQTQKATYNPSNGRWTGQLRSIDVAKMYKIKVLAACELTLQGDKVNPADHPLTITPGANWIAYELDAANTPAAVFGGFAVPGDYVKSQTQKKQYNANGRWTGQLNSLEPGQGYIYNSASSDTRTFSYDADKGSKGETSNK